MKLRAWLFAARPRTLLLATASIAMGLSLALSRGYGQWLSMFLCWLTATLLQVLSNFANDYGDFRHGADSSERLGPKRAVQSGVISAQHMLRAIIILAILAILSGLSLLAVSFGVAQLPFILGFVLLGGAAVWAAIAYTATDNPYGYIGLGDMMVFAFFGIVAVVGSYVLQAKSLSWDIFLAAAASGLLAVAVLNVNNIRDIDSDKKAGKRSIPVRIGARKARLYHACLLLFGLLAALLYVFVNYESPWQFLFVLSLPLFILHGVHLWQRKTPKEIDPLLKQLSISTLLFTLLFCLGQLL